MPPGIERDARHSALVAIEIDGERCQRVKRRHALRAARPPRDVRLPPPSVEHLARHSEHDVPEVLKKHAQAQGASPPLWTFAVASHPELSKIARPLGLTYGPGRDEIIHNLSIALIDPDGRLIKLETGPAARSWDLNDILKALYARIPRP